jgi:hypothetical protein
VLDTVARRLTRDGEEVLLGMAVTTNSLDHAIATLRRTLTLPSGEPCIETRARRGDGRASLVDRRAGSARDTRLRCRGASRIFLRAKIARCKVG